MVKKQGLVSQGTLKKEKKNEENLALLSLDLVSHTFHPTLPFGLYLSRLYY
jgi:hypothetical protein